MKTVLVALLATTITLMAKQQKQNFHFNNKEVPISHVFKVDQFDASKGTLTGVSIQAHFEVDGAGLPYAVTIDLTAPGVSEDNFLNQGGNGEWNAAVGVEAAYLPPYIGTGEVDLTVNYTGTDTAFGYCRITVTYTYDP